MTFFLFKPHVENIEGEITTPDVIIDRVFLAEGEGGAALATNALTSDLCSDLRAAKTDLLPAYMLIAAGAGELISPAWMTRTAGKCDRVHLARRGWRLKHLSGHAGDLVIRSEKGSAVLADFTAPLDLLMRYGGGRGFARGISVLCTFPDLAIEKTGARRLAMVLEDPVLDRSFRHVLSLEDVTQETWDQRPPPRYTVGPQHGDVKHYV